MVASITRTQSPLNFLLNQSNSKLQIRPLVREEITNRNCLKENLKEKEKLVAGPSWAPETKTDWPTDCRS
jgi:hypothetical protein